MTAPVHYPTPLRKTDYKHGYPCITCYELTEAPVSMWLEARLDRPVLWRVARWLYRRRIYRLRAMAEANH